MPSLHVRSSWRMPPMAACMISIEKSLQLPSRTVLHFEVDKFAEDVLKQFPFYDDLDELWRDNPSYAPKAFSSDPKANHSDCLQLMVHTKSAPASTSVGSSCPPADNKNLYANTNTVNDPEPSRCLPPAYTNPPQQLPQPPSFNSNDDEFDYNMVDNMVDNNHIYPDDTGDGEMDPGDGKMDADYGEMDMGNGLEGDYEMEALETETAGRNRADKRPRPFSPSPPPQANISQLATPHTPLYDTQASFTTHADRAVNRTPLSKSHCPSPSVAPSIVSSSTRSCSSSGQSGSVQMRTPSSNTSFSTKAKGVKHVRSDITDVRNKVKLLAQGVVAEHYSAKSSEKMMKLQIHQKERDQMFAFGDQLMQQSNSSLDHQRTLESKNADICLEQAKAQTHTLEMEFIRLKLQLGEQQLKLQQQQLKLAAGSSSLHAS
ncbi:uncharacterized protein F5147DRAFT_650860 [Suillus discolor]|uniref:Uncharacterized protein n=1 Tax=Suillus discolor TaxID=1912936 RepID=A0A9P7JVU4_9AGAM|nr:uncharacterized protein F5147DRAFT_650860 [Suillus discolor]KAG2112202.1 hypothetical protein F5147DRAFT_650860 [Suillus discolor]